MRTTKNHCEKNHEARETHQMDLAEAAKYLRDAADVLEKGGARGMRKEGEHERGNTPEHTTNYAHKNGIARDAPA
jgi:hypothetical protein